MVARVIDRTFENPALTGGLLVMALTATAIVSNAMFLQQGHHPEPLFKTRPPVRGSAGPVAIEAPPLRPSRLVINPPMPHPAPRTVGTATGAAALAPPSSVATAKSIPVSPPSTSSDTTLAQVQRELARLGLYSGAIDGMQGAQTASAIRSFEAATGRPSTGVATAELLAAMKRPPNGAAAAPASPAATSDPQAAELDRRERERTEVIAAQERQQAQDRMRANLRIVQAALNRIGYGPLPVDGIAGVETIDAIRRFQLDDGLAITGEASDEMIARLISIGAVKPG